MMRSTFTSYQRGLTIIELLIVIIVIAILFAITALVYSGTQNRSHSATAETAAMTVLSRAEAAYAATSRFPSSVSGANGFDNQPDSSLAGSGITLAVINSHPAKPQTVSYEYCEIGARVGWWDYTYGTVAHKTIGEPCPSYNQVTGSP